MELRERILEVTIEEFNEKNLKFTMDDIAKKLQISKKTIYTMFPDKDTLFMETVNYGFGQLKLSEKEILKDESLDIVEKIKRILIVLPNRYQNIDFRQIHQLREKYPKIYQQIELRIETDWDDTIHLLEQAMEQGKIKKINLSLFKMMVEAMIERFIGNTELITSGVAYDEALEEMRDILMNGICI